ncbi:hypothetical protein D3C81_1924650 [compost metagenome]
MQRAKRAGLFLCPLLLVSSGLQPALARGLQAQILLAELGTQQYASLAIGPD